MKLILSLLLIGVSLFWNGISEADAQTVRRPQNCAPRDAVLTRLAKSYGEVQQSQGFRTHNQNRTVAARAIADMKTFGHLS